MVDERSIPGNVIWFERLMYAAIALGVVTAPLRQHDWMRVKAALGGAGDIGVWAFVIGSAVISAAVVWLVARRRLNWLRWTWLALFVLGLAVGAFGLARGAPIGTASFVLGTIGILLQAAAFYFVFTGDAKPWFRATPSP